VPDRKQSSPRETWQTALGERLSFGSSPVLGRDVDVHDVGYQGLGESLAAESL
jgi:hypothetical protein